MAERCLWLPLLQGLSIACSTEHAIKWDESWANSHEISGRAMVSVHDAQQHLQADGHHTPPTPEPVGNGVSEVSAVHASCCGLVLYVHDAVRSFGQGASNRTACQHTITQCCRWPMAQHLRRSRAGNPTTAA